jgi:hypothetical protein
MDLVSVKKANFFQQYGSKTDHYFRAVAAFFLVLALLSLAGVQPAGGKLEPLKTAPPS